MSCKEKITQQGGSSRGEISAVFLGYWQPGVLTVRISLGAVPKAGSTAHRFAAPCWLPHRGKKLS